MNKLPEIVLNFWNFLFIGLSFIGLFFSIKLIIVPRLNSRASKALGFYLLLQSLALFESCLYWTNYFYRVPELYSSTLLFALLYGPLLVIYFDAVFENPKPLISYSFHFLPFLIMLGLKLPFYFSSPEIKILHPKQAALSWLINDQIDYAEIVKIAHLSIYSYVLFRQIRSHPGIGYMRPWANWILVFFISFLALTILYWLIVVTQGYMLLADYFISLSACGSIILLAWFGDQYEKLKEGEPIIDSLWPSLNHRSLQSDQPLSPDPHPDKIFSDEGGNIKYKNSGLPTSLAKKLAEDLALLMSKEQLYKENDLKLETLAEKLKSNRHFVSQVINQYYKTNFFDFINANRIDEAKRLLVSDQKLNIIEIAYAVGYNNKVTFNTVFKRFTGKTPSEYRKKILPPVESR
jgi:AraC-like DNA-binding protein